MFNHYILEKSRDSIIGTGIRIFLGNLKIEAYPFTKSFGTEFTIQDDFESTISFNLHIPLLFSFYIGYDSNYLIQKRIIRKLVGFKYGERRTSIRIFDWSIWINFWLAEDNCGNIKENQWRGFNKCFNTRRFFLGESKYESKTVKEGIAVIEMEEGSYKATWKMNIDSWKRPRWFKKTITRFEIEVKDGISHPGKGTTSYNCEDDALYSVYGIFDNLEAALQNFKNTVEYNRKNYPL